MATASVLNIIIMVSHWFSKYLSAFHAATTTEFQVLRRSLVTMQLVFSWSRVGRPLFLTGKICGRLHFNALARYRPRTRLNITHIPFVSTHVSLTGASGVRDSHGHRFYVTHVLHWSIESLKHCTWWSITSRAMLARDGNHVRSRREKLCVQHYRSYTVKRWAGKTMFILCMKIKCFVTGILAIRQNIIRQFLLWVISPKFSPSKILYCTV